MTLPQAVPISTLRVRGYLFVAALFVGSTALPAAAAEPTMLGVDGSRFTLNGEPTFLLGVSYYGGLGASADFVRQDLDDLQRHGFNWIRVWATWKHSGHDVSAVDVHGAARPPFLEVLRRLVAECNQRGIVVDVTLTRGKADAGGCVADFAAHQRGVETIVDALKDYRNWYLDLANERDVRDARYVPPAELKTLRNLVRRLDPQRIVTASFGGHDLSERDVRDALVTAELDFLSPHRPRSPESPGQTATKTRECLALMQRIDRVVPVHHQEPFRRGYTEWEPTAEDFLTDLRGAVEGGAAGWCFHNGSQRGADDQRPRRSFDLREKRLFDQFDVDERTVLEAAAASVKSASTQRQR